MSGDSKYYFDELAAKRAISFIETQCVHIKGSLGGQLIKLDEFQGKFVGDIFGWKISATGKRKYRRAYVQLPRKNAKSTLCAAIALYVLFGDNEPGAEVYSAAADKNQAGLVFNMAKQMVKKNPEMVKRAKIMRDSIVLEEDFSFYQVLSADGDTKDGFNSHCVVFDELHAQKKRLLWDVLTTSVGSRDQPLVLAITTPGTDRESVCYSQYDYACKVRDGIIEDEAFYPLIYEASIEDDPFDPKTWAKANPGLGTIVKEEYIRAEAMRAKTEPSYYNTFLRLHLGIWTSSETAWISPHDFDKCNQALVNPENLKGRECYGGLDLASTNDLSSLVLIFPGDDRTHTVLPFFWVPKEKAIERTNKSEVDYLTYIRQGFMYSTPGNVQDYNFIKKKILEVCELYNVKAINFDRYNASQLVIDLTNEGVPMYPFGQGYGSLSPPTKELEKLIMSEKVNHGGNPVLAWQMSNVTLEYDPTERVKPNKKKSKDKIDGIVAWVMAVGAQMQGPDDTSDSIYNDRGLISI